MGSRMVLVRCCILPLDGWPPNEGPRQRASNFNCPGPGTLILLEWAYFFVKGAVIPIPNRPNMPRIPLLALLLTGIFTHAQYGKNCEIRQFKINIFNPGLEYEMAVGVNSTLDFRVAWQFALEPARAEPLQNWEQLEFF